MVMDMNGRSHRPAGLPQGTAGTYEPIGGAGGDDDLNLENARMVRAETHSNPPASYGNLKPDWRRSDDWMGRSLYDDKAHASIHVAATTPYRMNAWRRRPAWRNPCRQPATKWTCRMVA